MCWKQEWAAAIGNIQKSIKHIDLAQYKLEIRYESNIETLGHNSGRNWDKFECRKIIERMMKNHSGIAQCKILKILLKERQDHLYQMIGDHGIVKANENKRLIALMNGYIQG